MKLREIIVVEGKDDTVAIKLAVDADTIETNGSAVNNETIEKVRLAQSTRGVIIFTDPDFPGERIRQIIADAVPDCMHAFLPKHKALPKRGKGLGVEHASRKDIQEALKDAHLMQESHPEIVTIAELQQLGLTAGAGAREKRERLGALLKIGYANGKQLHRRLMVFGISLEAFREAVKQL